jgi:Asp-tRNA(Asn)/Glu-tRNA(Gln) amidotransferase B subunit
MRSKANAIDYRYFTEPNIINMDISKLISSVLANSVKHHNEIKQELLAAHVSETLANQLLDDFELFRLFNYVGQKTDHNSAIT